jgi:hypothetical protein
MNNFSLDDLAKKDFFVCIGIWIALEVVSFVIFPSFRLIQPGDRLQSWFLMSLPLGILGAFMVGASSRYMAISNERDPGNARTLRIWLGQLIGGLGLAGVAFPLLMVMIEFFTIMLNTPIPTS